ncbi:hypothetical protein AB1484_37165 [Parafrankia sp. FMc6]|uniref:hypothetical protein n=1 Tax=Parafrankia soli TaxID=2599596 RepID=UPI0034D4003E
MPFTHPHPRLPWRRRPAAGPLRVAVYQRQRPDAADPGSLDAHPGWDLIPDQPATSPHRDEVRTSTRPHA